MTDDALHWIKDWLSNARWSPNDSTLYDTTNRVAFLVHTLYHGLHPFYRLYVPTTNRIRVDVRPYLVISEVSLYTDVPDLYNMGKHVDASFLQQLACDTSAHDHCSSQSPWEKAASTIVIITPVLDFSSVVRMSWTRGIFDLLIWWWVYVFIAYRHHQRSACSLSFEDATSYLKDIRFRPRRNKGPSSRSSSIEFCLYLSHVNLKSGWAALNDYSNTFTMALSKYLYLEVLSKRECHVIPPESFSWSLTWAPIDCKSLMKPG